MKFYKTLLVVISFFIFIQTLIAIPNQEEFYKNYYKIESKGFSGVVLSRESQAEWFNLPPLGFISPALGEHVSMSYYYSGGNIDKWIIAPISPGSDEFYIINKSTGNPLMIDGSYNVLCNTSGITEDTQRFKFKNINGDYTQITSPTIPGCFYKKQHNIRSVSGSVIGYYYTLKYSTNTSLNDDYSYFKFSAVESIPGSQNISTSNLVYQPNLKFNIPEPPDVTSYTGSAPEYVNETIIGESWVPYTLVDDPSYSPAVQVTQTPYYKLIRTQAWKKIKDYSYEPGGDYSISIKKYEGITQSEQYTTQNTLEHSWASNGNAEFTVLGVKVTLGASYSQKLSTTTTSVSSYSNEIREEITETLVFNTNYDVRFIIYELVDRYYVKRMDGSNAVDPWEIFYEDFYKFRTWAEQPIVVQEIPGSAQIQVTEDLPPAVPQNPSVAWHNDHPRITWDTNSEDDIAVYKVWKYAAGSSMIAATITHNPSNSTHSWVDYDVEPAGRFDPVITYSYKVKAIDAGTQESPYSSQVSINGTGGIWKESQEQDALEITTYALNSNYPNPFNPTTSITYQIPKDGFVNLTVYNSIGEGVKVLVNEYQSKSSYSVEFDASNLPSGIYFYKLQSNEFSQVKKMILAK
jgi:hypothetical protein